MSMRIDKARRHDQPVSVDRALGTLGHLADLRHLAIRDGDIGLVARSARAIDHGAVLDDEIVAHRRFLPGETFPESTSPADPWRMRKTRDCHPSCRAEPPEGWRDRGTSSCRWRSRKSSRHYASLRLRSGQALRLVPAGMTSSFTSLDRERL